jgi:DNA-binding NtrC family response regulator
MSEPRALKLLAIDDDPQNLDLIRAALKQEKLEILTADDPEAGFEMFQRVRPRLVLLEMAMPKVNGMELLERIVAVDPGTDVILMTADYSPESAVEAIDKGACDYMIKPLDVGKLRARIVAFLAEVEKRKKTLNLDRELLGAFQFEGMVGRSPLMLEVFAKIRRIAPHFRTVLVTGATGTGKELVARALHKLSPSFRGQFVVCNCPAVVESLVESELFGYVRGAFTGATQDKAGLFEHADGGTIFLDEIGELSRRTSGVVCMMRSAISTDTLRRAARSAMVSIGVVVRCCSGMTEILFLDFRSVGRAYLLTLAFWVWRTRGFF